MRPVALVLCLGLLSSLSSGCWRHYYRAMGEWGSPYGACVECGEMPPVPPRYMNQFERRQERELRKWYRELNHLERAHGSPGGYGACGMCGCGACLGACGMMGMIGGCPSGACGMGGCEFSGEYLGSLDGIDGVVMDGGSMMMEGNYCPSCMQQHGTVPSGPAAEPTPAPKSAANYPNASSEYYAPPVAAGPGSNEAAAQPVEQMQYMPQSFPQYAY